MAETEEIYKDLLLQPDEKQPDIHNISALQNKKIGPTFVVGDSDR